MQFLRLPIARKLLIWLAAAIMAAVCTLGILLSISQPEAEDTTAEAPVNHDIPAEVLCRIAATPQEEIPPSIPADKPHIRLREYETGKYELLYWGNPVRPSYAFSVKKLSTGKSVLLNAEGKREKWRGLPVSTPKRSDKALPLQPPVKLNRLEGGADTYYAAKISIHDASNGKVLGSAIYLLNGDSE